MNHVANEAEPASRYSLKRAYRRLKDKVRRQMPYLVVLAVMFGFAVVFFFDSIVISVHSGQLGVLWRRLGGGTVIDTVYGEGLHLVLPINKMYVYNVRKQQFADSIETLTVDGLAVSVRYSVRYYLSADTLAPLHQRIGPDYVNTLIKPEIRSVIRTIFGQYKPEEIYTTQKAIQERVSQQSKIRLEARYVMLDDVLIEAIGLPPKIAEAIEAKMTFQQQEGEYAYRLSIAKKEADRKRIEAEGIARYNQTIAESLTPPVMKWYGVKATENLATSNNSKTVVIGAGESGLPLILGRE